MAATVRLDSGGTTCMTGVLSVRKQAWLLKNMYRKNQA
jgi:hypothetical protein